jgi:hypothetical protein
MTIFKPLFRMNAFSIVLLYFTNVYTNTAHPHFNQVVLWGHKLHSGTHSYIHYAFEKAFRHLGYNTLWFDQSDDVSTVDFSNSLFITEGNGSVGIPLRPDCKYILHNCDIKKFKKEWDNNQCIILQVYTHDCLTRPVIKADDCIYYQQDIRTVYMPWATDLLPHEIDAMKKQVRSHQKKEKNIYWIGTIWHGDYGNRSKIHPFEQACRANNIHFHQFTYIDATQNIELIQKSYMAPALQGEWQCEKGYIPCRIFKNISYGQMGITNSKTVYDLFKGKIIYNEDPYQLFFDAQRRIKSMDIQELYDLMDFVAEKHTYLNRIEHLFNFMRMMNVIE